jgi:RND family efflux transporter MFP subunit
MGYFMPKRFYFILLGISKNLASLVFSVPSFGFWLKERVLSMRYMLFFAILSFRLPSHWVFRGALLFLFSHTLYATVSLKTLEEVVVFPEHSFAAEVISPNETTLSAQIPARIDQIKVRPGESVKQGQILVKLECHDALNNLALLEAQQKEIQASFAFAQTQLNRLKNLNAKDYAALTQVEESQANVKRLQASLEANRAQQNQAKRNAERCDISAPFNGIISEQFAGVGALANVGTPILSLVQTDGFEIKASIPLTLLAATQQSNVSFSANHLGEVQIKPLRQSKLIDSNTRNVHVWFKTEVPLHIGLLGSIRFNDPTPHLPAQLLVRRQGQLGIFVREDGKAKFLPLPLAQEGRPVSIPASWHSKHLAIISDGHQRLNDGDLLP